MYISIKLVSCSFLCSKEIQEEMTLPIIPLVLELNLKSTFKAASSSYIVRIPEPAESLKITVLLFNLQISEPEGALDLSNLSLSHSRTSACLQINGSYSISDTFSFYSSRYIRNNTLNFISQVPKSSRTLLTIID